VNPRSFEGYVRAATSAVLAFVIVGIAGWQVIVGGHSDGPFVNWGGIIVGVYFGYHIAVNGAGARKRSDDPEPPAR